MTERGNDIRLVSRRAALTGTAFALGAVTAAAVVRPAAAQATITQAVAKYQPTPNGKDHCELCANFVAPNACKFVQGAISPKGWCQLYSPKDAG
jgi:hypothetical protein